MLSTYAKTLAISINAYTGQRLITMELNYPRFIHAELMTHRVFSRNASSSRAIPVGKLIDQVENWPVYPIEWGTNKPGMQAGDELSVDVRTLAQNEWGAACNDAIRRARRLKDLGVHKQIVNRILEPFAYIRVIVTATEWDNFFSLRISELAQPEIRDLAIKMKEAQDSFTDLRICSIGDFHAAYVTDEERGIYDADICMRLSAARCARVSYLNHDGLEPNTVKDLGLADDLQRDRHASPFEHQAVPLKDDRFCRNFRGWAPYRSLINL